MRTWMVGLFLGAMLAAGCGDDKSKLRRACEASCACDDDDGGEACAANCEEEVTREGGVSDACLDCVLDATCDELGADECESTCSEGEEK